VWASRKLTAEEVNEIQLPAQQLEDEYWTDISQFLQHCTARRHEEFREWDLTKMFEQLKPITTAFKKSFARPMKIHVGKTVAPESASTATVTKGTISF
jgi:hypothetical protein